VAILLYYLLILFGFAIMYVICMAVYEILLLVFLKHKFRFGAWYGGQKYVIVSWWYPLEKHIIHIRKETQHLHVRPKDIKPIRLKIPEYMKQL